MAGPLPPVLRRLAACALAVCTFAVARALLRPVPERAIDCVVTFPLREPGTVEPLLVAGQAHAPDRLEVRYLAGGRIQIFWDCYGLGGPSSAPLDLPADRKVALGIDAPSLYGRFERRMLEDRPEDFLAVTVNGKPVLEGRVAFRRSSSRDRHLGDDPALGLRDEGSERFGGSLEVSPAVRRRVALRRLPWALAWTLTNSAGTWLALGWVLFAAADWRAARRNPNAALGPDARLLSGIGLAAVLATFLIGSAGQPFDLGENLNVYPEGYAMMTHAFAHGQLSLLQKPSPSLLALPDPYDARQNEGLRLHDAILYHDKYYFYYSPVPAVLMNLPVLWLTGTDVPQALAVTLWTAAGTVLMLAALLGFKRLWHPNLPLWALGALGLSIAFAAPVIYLVGRPTMYEQPVAAAYAFLGLGLFALAKALSEGGARRAEIGGRKSVFRGMTWPVISACGFALAAACRPNIAMACPGLGLMWLILAAPEAGGSRGASGPRSDLGRPTSRIFLRVFLLCLPFLAVGAGLGYLNWKRFGAPLDFGWRWQLWGRAQLASQATNFSVRNIPPNAQQYLYGPPKFSAAFPYVEANARKVYFRSPYTIGAEPLVGIAWALPLETFALLAWAAGLRGRRLADPGCADAWIGALLVAGGGVLLFNMMYSAFAMRYMPDFLPFLEIAGALAFMDWAGRLRRPAPASALVAIVVVAALAALAMSLDTGYLGFSWRNPELRAHIAACFP